MDSIPQKRCSVCKQFKLATPEFFEPNKQCRHGVVATCRECNEQAAFTRLQSPTQETKRCSKCKILKPTTLEFFHRRKARKSGLSSWCQVCMDQYKQDHSEERKRYNSKYGKEHKQERQQYYEARREEFRLYRQQRYQTNCEEIKQQVRLYTNSHKQQVSQNKKRYYRTHLPQVAALRHKSRARRKAAEGTFTARDIRKQYHAQKGKCYYCKIALESYHIDHIIPLSRGGSNNASNIVLACAPCNLSKHDRLPHEWPQGNRLL